MRYSIIIFLATMIFGSFACSPVCHAQTTEQVKKVKKAKAPKVKELESEGEPETKADVKPQTPYKQVQGKLSRRYLFGVAQSYSDSTIFITNITPVDGMNYDVKTNTPVGIDLYTASLRDFLATQGKTSYVCTTFFFKDIKDAEKKVLKIRKKANKNNATKLMPLAEFKYEYISTEHIQYNTGEQNEDF